MSTHLVSNTDDASRVRRGLRSPTRRQRPLRVPAPGLLLTGLVSLQIFATIVRAQNPGQLDSSFNGTGSVTGAFSFATVTGNCLAVQNDGKIVVAGVLAQNDADFAVRRYNADGTPDIGFGTGGTAIIDIAGRDDNATALAVQPDGKIVVAGYSVPGTGNPVNYDFSLIRLLADGTLDQGFNGTGKITRSVGPLEDRAYAVAVDSNNNVIVAGFTSTGPEDTDFALFKYTEAGLPDPQFGEAGRVITALGVSYDQANDIAIQNDGKLVVVGSSRHPQTKQDGFAVLRYDADGTLDTTFNSTGVVVNQQGDPKQARSVALQPDGKIVVGGSWDATIIARYLQNGTPDLTFNGTGMVRSLLHANNPESLTSVAVQSDGRIIVGGNVVRGSRHGSMIARFDLLGNRDGSFGTDGYVTAIYGEPIFASTGLALQKDGRIVSSGGSFSQADDRFVISRHWAFSSEQSWRLRFFGTTEDAGIAAQSSDPDNDGLNNLLEFAFNLDPGSGSSNQIPEGKVLNGDYVVRFTHPPDVLGLTYRAQWSGTMEPNSWLPIPDSGLSPTHEFKLSTIGRPRAFVRLMAERVP
jgi:uncharacterized delta-60 repeat protein